jgi:hypothetical protein
MKQLFLYLLSSYPSYLHIGADGKSSQYRRTGSQFSEAL